MSSAPTVFEARNLQVVRSGALILNVPLLAVPEGEILVLIGPNGAGKSTLLQALAGLVKPSRGEIRFRGRSIGADIPLLEYRRKLAMVLQEPLLFDTTVDQNVASGLKIRGLKRKEIEPIVAGALDRFGINHLRGRSARTLSGGEARRVSIARALATDPEVLLLDEPFSALDPIIRETLMEDLERVLRETRITTIFVTHSRMEALRLATRLGVMKSGEILQTGAPGEVLRRPANAFVASLVGVETVFEGRVLRSGNETFIASIAGREIEAAGQGVPGETVSLCIRPENIFLSAQAPPNGPGGMNVLRGPINKIVPFGFYTKVQVDCGFPLTAYITNHDLADLSFTQGAPVFASFHAHDIHVMREEGSDGSTCARNGPGTSTGASNCGRDEHDRT